MDGGKSPSPTPANPYIDQFTSDKSSYFVGDRAQLTAAYSNGTARIQPGDITIASGHTITTPTLTTNTTYRLEVVGNGNTTIRELALTVSFHDRMRAIAVPFARTEHMAVRLNDGRVLIVGGRDESKMVARQMYVFDPSSETFTVFGSIDTSDLIHCSYARRGNAPLDGGIPASAVLQVLINAQTGDVTPTGRVNRIAATWGDRNQTCGRQILFAGGLLASRIDDNAIEICTTADPIAEIYDSATRGVDSAAGSTLPVVTTSAVTANDGQHTDLSRRYREWTSSSAGAV